MTSPSPSSPRAKRPRVFAPLEPDRGLKAADGREPELQGVVFDVDGTLCEPQNYMFTEMRHALQIDKKTDILTHISQLPLAEQSSALEAIRAIESRAMVLQTPSPGLVELMAYLDRRSIRKGICTRNFDAPVTHLLEKFLQGTSFHPIVTRDFKPPKPDPAGILHIARSWDLDGAEGLIMVGDSLDDMTAGHRAGAATVLLVNEINAHLAEHEHTDLCIKRLDDLVRILERGFRGEIAGADEEPNTKAQAEKAMRS